MNRCEKHNLPHVTEECPACMRERVHIHLEEQQENKRARIIPLNNVTRLDLPPERILSAVPDLAGVVLMGRDKEGEYYFASSYADGGEVLWLIEKLKRALMGD